MYKKTIKFIDFNGTPREEEHYFNLSQPELLEMEVSTEGGMGDYITNISNAENTKELIALFKDLVLKSYGKKSDDGRSFEKSEEIARKFSQTAAYNALFMELATNTESAIEFANGVIPSDIELPKTENNVTVMPTA